MTSILVAIPVSLLVAATPEPIDPTIPLRDYKPGEEARISDTYSTLRGPEKDCAARFIRSYQDSLFAYCEATDGGAGIGGGCPHVAYAWSIHTRVIEAALESCTNSRVKP
jgi:hypothetical protein